jgi:lysophospholipase L1-like esterase
MIASKLTKWTAGLLLVCVTFELCARLDDWWTQGAHPLKPYTINTLFKATNLGREGVPFAKFSKWQINSLGYRGPESDPTKRNILTFGASETFGLYESPNKEYPRQLEQLLNQRGSAFNVVNIALPGIRVGRVGYLNDAIQKTSPTHVVVYPSPANYIGTTSPFCTQASVPVPPEKGLADTLRIAGKLEQFTKTLLPEWVTTPMRKFAIWRAIRQLDSVGDEVPQSALDALAVDLRCISEKIRASGAKPVLATHANYFGDAIEPSERSMALAWRRFYPELTEDALIHMELRANDVIRRVGAELNIPVVDAAHFIEPGAANFADFVHFTDRGAMKMAELLADQIH